MHRVLITGASGFVGSVLCPTLAQAGYRVRAAMRVHAPTVDDVSETTIVGDIGAVTDWTEALRGVDLVVHLAARAHVLTDDSSGNEAYMSTNSCGTARLAEQCAQYGVRRLIFLSSVKVNGEETTGRSYSADDEPRPQDAYGRSKWLGEQLMWGAVRRGPTQAAVVRSPLVYGPGVRANFLRLMNAVEGERWLPLGALHNARSLVNVWNLCDLLLRVLEHPAAVDRTWMVSDGRDVSTPELVQSLAAAMGRRARLLPIPIGLLRCGGALLGKAEEARRLCGSLSVDIGPTRKLLDWQPPVSMAEGLARTVAWYRSRGRAVST